MAHLRSIRRAQTPNPQALGITVPLPFGKPGTPRSPRAVARTKKNPGGEPGLSLGRTLGVFTLPDSPAAGRKVSRLPSSLDGPALPLGSLPAGVAKPPSEMPCFIGTSPSGILGFGGRQVAELDCLPALLRSLFEFYDHGRKRRISAREPDRGAF